MANLSYGSTGEDVKKLQSTLAGLGYDVGSSGVDGIYGAKTQAAVKQYQQDNGLASDGIVGAKTTAALYGNTGQQASAPVNTAPTTAANMFSADNYSQSEYIRQQKASDLEAKLAALKGAYDNSSASLDAARTRLPQTYEAARNEAAAQSALAKRAFDERAAATGLNNGTAGQADLARSSVLQRNLAGIGQQEANAQSDLDLQRAQLMADYQSAIAAAKADNDAELSDALYNEMLRMQAQEQKKAVQAATAPTSANVATMTNKATDSTADTGASRSYDNGGLTKEQVRLMQDYFGATADGLWGKNSTAAAGGMSADQAWEEYQRLVYTPTADTSAYDELDAILSMNRTVTKQLGRANLIAQAVSSGTVTDAQAEKLLKKYGLM